MASINGPRIQVPTGLTPIQNESGGNHPEWQTFFHSVQQTVFAGTRSGPTASRPNGLLDGRYIGMAYFDTDLGLTVYLKAVNPFDVWVNGAGAVV